MKFFIRDYKEAAELDPPLEVWLEPSYSETGVAFRCTRHGLPQTIAWLQEDGTLRLAAEINSSMGLKTEVGGYIVTTKE